MRAARERPGADTREVPRCATKSSTARGPSVLWTGALDHGGYGRVSNKRGGSSLAHRRVYERERGPVPPGLVLDHLCSNPPCVNPDHLEPVTQGENVRRSVTCKRDFVTDSAIRWLVGEGNSGRAVGRLFGVSHTFVQHVLNP